jgi:DNA mismatch endonuclease, patch repair protein
MAAVRSRGNTATELPLTKLLWEAGIRGYGKHWPVAGKPDLAWPGRKVAVFVDGMLGAWLCVQVSAANEYRILAQ